MFTKTKRDGKNIFVYAVFLNATETATCKASIKDHEPPLPTIPFGIVAYSFVGQPFSKQLYIRYTTLYLAPCLPPLLGLIKTAKGCVPRRGEICQENFVVSFNAFI